MKQNHIAKSLLAGTGVSENDAARLTLEAIETLGELATGTSRPELVTLLRRVIQAGVAAVKAAEHTVSLSVAAWASVEARKDLRPTTRRDLRHFVRRILRVEGAADMPLRSMSFSLSLMLYGGIRPTEVSRLQAGDINWEEGHVIIRPRTSKTGGGRAVPLRGVRGIRKRERFIPRNWKRKWQALRRAAGFRHWVPDVCRHTFATYHAAMFRNLPELQLEMGHRDTSLLRSRYMVPASRKEAEKFWRGCR